MSAPARPARDGSAQAPDAGLLLDAGRDPACAAIATALTRRCGIDRDDVLAIGASGGPDSSALLLFAGVLAVRGAIAGVVAIHVDHGLRAESSAEGDLVQHLAARLGVSFERRAIEIDADAPGVAARARVGRLRALADVACEHRATVLALAHHADDQAETVLHALMRGSGPVGLAGLRWRRPFPLDDAAHENARERGALAPDLVRPCLELSHATLVEACARHGVPVATDPTNDDPTTLRGWMRTALAPCLESRFPGAMSRIAASAERLTIAAEAIEESLDRRFGPASSRAWERAVLSEATIAWRTALLRRAVVARRPDAADSIASGTLDRVALAVDDGEQRPRRWAIMPGTVIEIDARVVRVIDEEPSSCSRAEGPSSA